MCIFRNTFLSQTSTDIFVEVDRFFTGYIHAILNSVVLCKYLHILRTNQTIIRIVFARHFLYIELPYMYSIYFEVLYCATGRAEMKSELNAW